MTTLAWVYGDEQYSADSGDRTYIVRTFHPAAHDGDPKLLMRDDRYRSECWALITWHGNVTKGPTRLFDDLAAAQIAEDEASP